MLDSRMLDANAPDKPGWGRLWLTMQQAAKVI
jgi:hypothetical protein